VRWHADAWKCPQAKALSCAIYGLHEDVVRTALGSDVFGRRDTGGDTFEEWSRYVALVPWTASLAFLLERIAELSPCPITSWLNPAKRAELVAPLLQAILRRDQDAVIRLARAGRIHDWDATCSSHPDFGDAHTYAYRITAWLSSVSAINVPWDEGEALFRPLSES